MNRVQHPSNNAVLGAPADWDQKQLPCGACPVTRTEVDGLPVVVSYWQPTAEEKAAIAAGAMVALWVVGTSMPPVSIEIGL